MRPRYPQDIRIVVDPGYPDIGPASMQQMDNGSRSQAENEGCSRTAGGNERGPIALRSLALADKHRLNGATDDQPKLAA
jgi:hypothetical protein